MNEKVTEEIANIADTTKKFTDEAGRLVLDRFRNPYILTFLISWILFNWRPISYFILSDKTIEEKITFINTSYSDYLNYFIYPFGITMLYLFALPYLNMINEWCVKWSVRYRAEYAAGHLLDKIKNDTKIAIAEDKKQKAIADEKESGDRNKYVKDLETNLKNVQDTLAAERGRNSETVNKLNELNKKLTSDISEAYNKMTETNSLSNRTLRENQNKIRELEEQLKSNKEKEAIEIVYNKSSFDRWIENKNNLRESQLLNINGRKIFQGYMNDNLYFYDLKTNLTIEPSSVFALLNNGHSSIVEDPQEIHNAVTKFNHYLRDNSIIK